MTYIADLAPYDYHPDAPDGLAVGWLDRSKPFRTGECPPAVRDKLADLAQRPIRLMRGYHRCQFCLDRQYPSEAVPPAEWSDVAHGNGEIWVTANDGTNYATPTLLVHYIDAHRYLPPDPFIAAVRDSR